MNNKTGKKWSVFFLVASAVFMSTLDSSIVNVALPYIMEDLHTRVEVIQWVVAVYLLTVSSLLLTFGRLSDINGRKVIYTSGFVIFTAGSLLCSMAGSPAFLIASRAVQGMGASMLMACSPALVVDMFEPGERGRALGMIGTVVAAGLTAGPVAGGFLLDLFSWRAIFYINIPIGTAATVAGLYVLKGTGAEKGTGEPLDVKGGFLLILFLGSLLMYLTHIREWGPAGPLSILFLVLSAAGCYLFIKVEAQAHYPLFPPELLKIRLFTFSIISAVLVFAALFIIIFMMPFFLAHPYGLSASSTGLVMVTPFVFLFFISPVAGELYDRIGSRALCTAGAAMLAASLGSLVFITPDSHLFSILWRMALAGIGTSVFISPNNTSAMTSTPVSRRGIASGAVATARNFGMVLGVAVAGLIFSGSISSSLTGGDSLENYTSRMEPAFMTGFTRTMLAGMLIAVSATVSSFLRGKERS
ncbi:MAG: MFS transporter [Desulfobacteraceae bacterium]